MQPQSLKVPSEPGQRQLVPPSPDSNLSGGPKQRSCGSHTPERLKHLPDKGPAAVPVLHLAVSTWGPWGPQPSRQDPRCTAGTPRCMRRGRVWELQGPSFRHPVMESSVPTAGPAGRASVTGDRGAQRCSLAFPIEVILRTE